MVVSSLSTVGFREWWVMLGSESRSESYNEIPVYIATINKIRSNIAPRGSMHYNLRFLPLYSKLFMPNHLCTSGCMHTHTRNDAISLRCRFKNIAWPNTKMLYNLRTPSRTHECDLQPYTWTRGSKAHIRSSMYIYLFTYIIETSSIGSTQLHPHPRPHWRQC